VADVGEGVPAVPVGLPLLPHPTRTAIATKKNEPYLLGSTCFCRENARSPGTLRSGPGNLFLIRVRGKFVSSSAGHILVPDTVRITRESRTFAQPDWPIPWSPGPGLPRVGCGLADMAFMSLNDSRKGEE